MTIKEELSHLVSRYWKFDVLSSADSATIKLGSESGPRVLFVDNQVSDFSGHRMQFAHTLRQIGFDVHVALPQESGIDSISRHGFPVHTFYILRKSTHALDELRSVVSLVRLYRRLRPTIVHHISLKPALYGGIAARIAAVPAAVSTLKGLGYLFKARTKKARILRSAVIRGLRFSFLHENHRVIFQNMDDHNYLTGSGIVAQDRALVIKGSGIDTSSFTRQPEPDGLPVVLMASRLLWQKGVSEFVAAARKLRFQRVQARFVLLGEHDDGHPSAIPSRTLKVWHDAGDVEWLGWRNDIPALIAQSHIVCLPSYYGEGVPRILLEAAASGRPMVTTDSPGCRDVVRAGVNGLLVPERNVEALASAIDQLVRNAPLRKAMGMRSREIAIREFSIDRVIDANLAVYRSLVVSKVSSTVK